MNRRIKKIRKKIVASQIYFGAELFTIAGLLMILGTLIKLLGIADFSSDWFWFIAGLGLVTEGSIMLVKKRRHNRTYMVLGGQ